MDQQFRQELSGVITKYSRQGNLSAEELTDRVVNFIDEQTTGTGNMHTATHQQANESMRQRGRTES